MDHSDSPDLSGVRQRLAQEPDGLRRRLVLAAWLNARLAEVGGRVAIVGGGALEFYTHQEYTTADLDLVTVDRALVGQWLESLGFVRDGRYWRDVDLNLLVEVPDDALMIGSSPGDWDRTSQVEVVGVGVATVLGVEELLVDRLLAAKFWSDRAAAQWASALVRYYGPSELDLDYLRALARRERVEDSLEQALAERPDNA